MEFAALRNRPSVYLTVIALAAVFVTALLVFRLSPFNFFGQLKSRPGGQTHTIGANGNLQRAIDRAQPGDVIVVEANATYTGPFTLPNKSGNSYITIQTSKLAELPEGARVGPAQSALLAKLQSATAGEPVLKTTAGAHHYRFVGVDISTASDDTKVYDLVQLGDSKQTSAQVPHDIVIDRSYIHGFSTQEVQRGVSLNGAEITVSNSHISDIHGRGYDTQALCGWNGPGPFHIINNYLEAAGENVMFGGALPSITNLVPANIEIRRNHFFKPLSWKEGHPTYAGIHWTIKNLLEFKNARNVVVDGNVLENCWTDAQIGYAILFTVRGEDGRAPWAILENLTFTNNTVRNADQGLQLLGKDERPSQRGNGLVISNNLFTGIAHHFLTISGFYNVTLDHNTHFQGGNIMALHGEPSIGFVYTNNITNRSSSGYGIFGDGIGEGNGGLARFVPGHSMKRNVLIGASASQYPGNNAYPATVEKVGFQDYRNGNYRLTAKSPLRGTATDGTDPGCHVDRLVSH
jgi:Right handed beta helix region